MKRDTPRRPARARARIVDALCLLGTTPQVLPELVFALSRSGHRVRHLTIVATHGVRNVFGQVAADRGRRGVGPRLLELARRFPAASVGGEVRTVLAPVDDVGDDSSVRRVGRTIDRALVEAVARAGETPLVACLTGGRKSMSAWLTIAMCLRARETDRLVHVLVDPALERPNIWPPRDADDAHRVRLADISFPRPSDLLRERSRVDIDALVVDLTTECPPPLRNQLRIVATLRATLATERSLAVYWQGEKLRLPPLARAMLALYADQGGVVAWRTLLPGSDVRVRFDALYAAAQEGRGGGPVDPDPLGFIHNPAAGRRTADIHSELRRALRRAPGLYKALDLRARRGDPHGTYEAHGLRRLDTRLVCDLG